MNRTALQHILEMIFIGWGYMSKLRGEAGAFTLPRPTWSIQSQLLDLTVSSCLLWRHSPPSMQRPGTRWVFSSLLMHLILVLQGRLSPFTSVIMPINDSTYHSMDNTLWSLRRKHILSPSHHAAHWNTTSLLTLPLHWVTLNRPRLESYGFQFVIQRNPTLLRGNTVDSPLTSVLPAFA